MKSRTSPAIRQCALSYSSDLRFVYPPGATSPAARLAVSAPYNGAGRPSLRVPSRSTGRSAASSACSMVCSKFFSEMSGMSTRLLLNSRMSWLENDCHDGEKGTYNGFHSPFLTMFADQIEKWKRPHPVGTGGRAGWMRGPCACPLRDRDSSALRNPTNHLATKDRHKAPTRPLIRPLSLQDGNNVSLSKQTCSSKGYPCGQVFVFHFPGVIQRVIRGVPNQIPQRPGTGQFALRMECPNGVAIGVTVRLQPLVAQHRILGSGYPDLLCPLLLHAKRMTDDVIPITPSPSWTLLHLSRHAHTHVVEQRPARLHQGQFTFQFCARKVLPIDAGERERDAPEVG